MFVQMNGHLGWTLSVDQPLFWAPESAAVIYVFTSLAKENCFPLNCLNKLIIFTLNQIQNGEREGTLLTVDDSLEIFCELDQAGFGGMILITVEMKMPSKNSFFKKVSDWDPNS